MSTVRGAMPRWVLLASLSGCAAVPPGPPPCWEDCAPTAQLDVACEALVPHAQFDPPVPWTAASPAYDAYGTWLEASPYRATRSGTVDRSVADLASFEGSLFVGIGDYGFNAGSRFCPEQGEACPFEDAPGHGIPVLRVDEPDAKAPRIDHVVREEAVAQFRAIGDQLVVPGIDPTVGDAPLPCQRTDAKIRCPDEPSHERQALGVFHRLHEDRWTDDEDAFQGGLHIFDHSELGGCLYAVGAGDWGPSSYATVWSSCEGGSWEVVYRDLHVSESPRMTASAPVGPSMVVFGHKRGDHSFQFRAVLRPDGWRERSTLALELRGRIRTEVLDDSVAVAWSTDGSALRLSLGLDDEVVAEVLEGTHPDLRDAFLRCDGDLLLLSATPRDEENHRTFAVQRTSDLLQMEPLLEFRSRKQFTSLALWEGQLVLGTEDGELFVAPSAEPVR